MSVVSYSVSHLAYLHVFMLHDNDEYTGASSSGGFTSAWVGSRLRDARNLVTHIKSSGIFTFANRINYQGKTNNAAVFCAQRSPLLRFAAALRQYISHCGSVFWLVTSVESGRPNNIGGGTLLFSVDNGRLILSGSKARVTFQVRRGEDRLCGAGTAVDCDGSTVLLRVKPTLGSKLDLSLFQRTLESCP